MTKRFTAIILAALFLFSATAPPVFAERGKVNTQQLTTVVLSGAGTVNFTIGQTERFPYETFDYVCFYININASTLTGTTAVTVEVNDGGTLYNIGFDIYGVGINSVAQSTFTIPNTVARYVVVCRLADYGGMLPAPVRLTITNTAGTGTATIVVKAVTNIK